MARLAEVLRGIRRLAGVEAPRGAAGTPARAQSAPSSAAPSAGEFASEQFGEAAVAPTVLVVGATGETGRVIVRKLLLRGYGVRVLVRDLFSRTLDTLGTGCEYIKGDLTDTDSLLEAVYGVDKVVCAVHSDEGGGVEAVDAVGVRNLVRAFQDARFLEFGRGDSAKLTLFKFDKDKHFAVWSAVQQQSQDDDSRLAASAAAAADDDGDGDEMRSGSSERNVFGAARPAATAATADESTSSTTAAAARPVPRKAARISFLRNDKCNAVFVGHVYDAFNGYAEAVTIPFASSPLNFRGFSGVIIRCIGDGKTYSFVVRTSESDARGMQYVARFSTLPSSSKSKWCTVRLSFSRFVAQERATLQDVTTRAAAPELDRAAITQFGVQFQREQGGARRRSNAAGGGDFYLAIDHIKLYRTQDEPDFVLVTCAASSPMPGKKWKRAGERALRASGLAYCIVRPGTYTDEPGGMRAVSLDQAAEEAAEEEQADSAEAAGGLDGERRAGRRALVVDEAAGRSISRADIAELCVTSLLDPRACNVTFEAHASAFAPTAKIPTQDFSMLFGQLRPDDT